jgi:Domain of unknown function (DUF6378)
MHDIVNEALRLIHGDRQESYGDAKENNGRIAALWSAYLGTNVTAVDVAKMMVLLKLSRSRQRYHKDNYVDAVAYLLLAEDFDNGSSN